MKKKSNEYTLLQVFVVFQYHDLLASRGDPKVYSDIVREL